MSIVALIGDYQTFFQDLWQRLKAVHIAIEGRALTQLLYRTERLSEYEALRDRLKTFCREFVETEFNGRAVSILVLKDPLLLGGGFSVDCIELPAPRPAHTYPSGLESIGVYAGKELATFQEHPLVGVKDHGLYCQPAFITFDNQKTVKFYDTTLIDIILLQGWKFEQLREPPDSTTNQTAKSVNAWLWYFHTVPDWKDLLKERKHPPFRPDGELTLMDVKRGALPQRHPERTFYVVLQGRGKLAIGQQETPLQKETTVVVPPDTVHTITVEENLELAVIRRY